MAKLTYEEVLEKLKQLPEIDLLEVLEIYSDELVDRFPDKIEAKYNQLVNEFDGDIRDFNNEQEDNGS